MAKMWVAEYDSLAQDKLGRPVLAPREPPIVAPQVVDFSGGQVSSAAFNAATRFVMISPDANCHYQFGVAPTATTSHMRMVAGEKLFVGVDAFHGHSISVIAE